MIPCKIKLFNYFITCYMMIHKKKVQLGSEIKKELFYFEILTSKNPDMDRI